MGSVNNREVAAVVVGLLGKGGAKYDGGFASLSLSSVLALHFYVSEVVDFSVSANEEFLQNVKLIAERLKPHGYEYAVLDYLWYRNRSGALDSPGLDSIDEWGRMLPDPFKFPSSKGGKGLGEIAANVHNMGLKFGIHLMAGISTQAVNKNTPILDPLKGKQYEEGGKKWFAQDIAIKSKPCSWMPHCFMSVNLTLGAGKAFLSSLYQLYNSWNIDFVKLDCVFGSDFDLDEITYVSELLQVVDRPVVFSLSPGTSMSASLAKQVSGMVNMYRITGDDWDKWSDPVSHFDIIRDLSAANLIGAQSAMGTSWPDMDMLPLGWLTDPAANYGPFRNTRLTTDEQRIQMTLWSMTKSPLMFGGDMRKLDQATFDLITNPTLLEINAFSSNNMEYVQISTRSLSFVKCSESRATGWSVEVANKQTCWVGEGEKDPSPFCLQKKELHTAPLEVPGLYQGKLHLVEESKTQSNCFEGSANKKLTSGEFNSGSFSPCRVDANQIWELHSNGTLQSSYSGLCASLAAQPFNTSAIRPWIATGRNGEVYLAFFNLGEAKTEISTSVSDLGRALTGRNLDGLKGIELWSKRSVDTSAMGGLISAEVEKHACALFVLKKEFCKV
ncbi:hypothetical protein L6164_028872 [Bauhinia variegata]|uniref:Uncharacterized protein n=1 Tax=Bauhinia variegata TaxID=167791 RepID=A0ACB9L7L2_BAUVA|nr:hypothetical protein L6164_028872 [Bauhinia variegata]